MILRTILLLIAAIPLCVSTQAQVRPQGIEQERDQPLNIVVSVAPQRYLVKKITGDLAMVSVMIAAGQTPATWEPSPRKMAQLAATDILFSVGVPFEKVWLPRLQQNFPTLPIIDPRSKIELLPLAEHHHKHDTDPDDGDSTTLDPHIWLDPLRDIQMAENMTAAICQQDPANTARYQHNLNTLRLELQQLHQQIATVLHPYSGQQFMVFHPSWGYFAQRYNLHQLAIELDGKEPRGAKLAQITELARHNNITVIFVQQQFSQKAAATIARQIGAKIVTLDPLAEDISHSLLATAQQIKSAME